MWSEQLDYLAEIHTLLHEDHVPVEVCGTRYSTPPRRSRRLLRPRPATTRDPPLPTTVRARPRTLGSTLQENTGTSMPITMGDLVTLAVSVPVTTIATNQQKRCTPLEVGSSRVQLAVGELHAETRRPKRDQARRAIPTRAAHPRGRPGEISDRSEAPPRHYQQGTRLLESLSPFLAERRSSCRWQCG